MKYNADPKIRDNSGRTPLHYIRCLSSLNVIMKEYSSNQDTNKVDLLDMEDQNGNTPLMQCILDDDKTNSKRSIIKEMIKKDADFSIQNNKGDN